MAPHSSTLAWKIPWTEEPGRLQSMGVAKSWTRLSDSTFTFLFSCTGEGNGNPLQYSCLENPRDDGAWWAAVYGVAQSRTRLKRLSIAQCRQCLKKKKKEKGNEPQMILFYSLSNQKLPFKNGNYSDLNARSLSGKSNKNHSKIFCKTQKYSKCMIIIGV